MGVGSSEQILKDRWWCLNFEKKGWRIYQPKQITKTRKQPCLFKQWNCFINELITVLMKENKTKKKQTSYLNYLKFCFCFSCTRGTLSKDFIFCIWIIQGFFFYFKIKIMAIFLNNIFLYNLINKSCVKMFILQF